MPFDAKSLCFLHALLDDKYISFNIRRSQDNISPFPRNIIAVCFSPTRETIIPGVAGAKEKGLVSELKEIQNWRKVKEHSFDLDRILFSLLWRFGGRGEVAKEQIRGAVPLDKKTAREVKSGLKRYRSSLERHLRPGQIFLVPDTVVTFSAPNRFRQIYARPALVFDVQANQVIIMPFSTRIERMSRATDILFDSAYQGKCLDPEGTPAVENFPYKLFKKKTGLFVIASQALTRENFVSVALTHSGTVRIELLKFIRKRMKNIPI